MWFGFAIPATINSFNALHAFYNFIPCIDLSNNILILRNSVNLLCTPRFEVIGLSYLLSLDVSMGVWFFALLALSINRLSAHAGLEYRPHTALFQIQLPPA